MKPIYKNETYINILNAIPKFEYIKDISKVLEKPQGVISRQLKHLKNEGYVSSIVIQPNNKKRFSVSSKGLKLLESIDQIQIYQKMIDDEIYKYENRYTTSGF